MIATHQQLFKGHTMYEYDFNDCPSKKLRNVSLKLTQCFYSRVYSKITGRPSSDLTLFSNVADALSLLGIIVYANSLGDKIFWSVLNAFVILGLAFRHIDFNREVKILYLKQNIDPSALYLLKRFAYSKSHWFNALVLVILSLVQFCFLFIEFRATALLLILAFNFRWLSTSYMSFYCEGSGTSLFAKAKTKIKAMLKKSTFAELGI